MGDLNISLLAYRLTYITYVNKRNQKNHDVAFFRIRKKTNCWEIYANRNRFYKLSSKYSQLYRRYTIEIHFYLKMLCIFQSPYSRIFSSLINTPFSIN